MKATNGFATVVTAAALTLGSANAWASDQYSFPSAAGANIAAQTPTFVAPAAGDPGATTTGTVSVGGASYKFVPPTPTSGRSHDERYGVRSQAAEAYAYRFLTHALNSSSYANYAADYARLFAPGYAVTTWTDRMFGAIDAGYGGPVDGWTAAAYYLPRARGPVRRGESAPDLSTMPAFRPHPELQAPTFNRSN